MFFNENLLDNLTLNYFNSVLGEYVIDSLLELVFLTRLPLTNLSFFYDYRITHHSYILYMDLIDDWLRVQNKANVLPRDSFFTDLYYKISCFDLFYNYKYDLKEIPLLDRTLDDSVFIGGVLEHQLVTWFITKEEFFDETKIWDWVYSTNGIESYKFSFSNLLTIGTYILLFLFLYLQATCNYVFNKNKEVEDEQIKCTQQLLSEKEIGSIDDLINTMMILFFLFFGYVLQLFATYVCLHLPYFDIFMSSALVFFLMTAANLISLIWELGTLFIVYIKGSSRKTSFIAESFLDFLFICSYIIRTLIQNVRVAVIFIFYISYMHAMDTQNYEIIFSPLFSSKIYNSEFRGNATFTYIFLYKLLDAMVHVVYEAVHFGIIFAAQMGSFLMIVFWIFNTLYFSFEDNKTEKFILVKKNKIRQHILRNKTKYRMGVYGVF